MTYHRDGNMIVDGNRTVVCLMCECDSFGGLHTAHNADANAAVILKALNNAPTIKPLQWIRGERISSADWMYGEFMTQPQEDGFVLFQFFKDENEELKMTDHPTREAAEAAAQALHDAEVSKWV